MRRLKHVWGQLAIVAAVALALAACQGPAALAPTPAGSSAAPAAGQQASIRVAVDPTYPLFVNTDSQQQLAGYVIDVMQAVAGRAGLRVEFHSVARDQLISGVSNCTYDAGISAIAMSDALRQQVSFSEPYLTLRQALVIKKGNLSITGRDAMADMTVGVQKGSPSAEEVLNVNDAQPVLYPTVGAAFQDLVGGYIDAVIADQPLAKTYVSTPANNLKFAGDQFGRADYAIAVCKQRPDLTEQINAGLAAIKADGTLDKLTQKWLKAR